MNYKHSDSVSGLYRANKTTKSVYYDVFKEIFANYQTIKSIYNATKKIDFPIGDSAVANHVLSNASTISVFETEMIDYALNWKGYFFDAVPTGTAKIMMAEIFSLLLDKYSVREVVRQLNVSTHTVINSRYVIINIIATKYESARL